MRSGSREVLYPEDIFYYIYGVLHSPTYRTRYAEFLKIDFPRIPLPKDYESFEDTVDDLVKRRGWTTEARDHILIGSEGRENTWGLVQGVSAAANRVDDEDLQTDMRLVAGSYLA